jgi:hypothetical protein
MATEVPPPDPEIELIRESADMSTEELMGAYDLGRGEAEMIRALYRGDAAAPGRSDPAIAGVFEQIAGDDPRT